MVLNLTNKCNTCKNSILFGNNGNIDAVICNSINTSDRKNFNEHGTKYGDFCVSYEYEARKIVRKCRIEQSTALEVLLAGNSEFILHSTKTNEDFRFKLCKQKKKDNANEFIYFVNYWLNGEYVYAGLLWFTESEAKFSTGKNGKMPANSKEIKSLLFVINKLFNQETVQFLEIYHTGRCSKCGKKLTDLDSMLTGLGPTCSKNLGIQRIVYRGRKENKGNTY